MDDPDAIELKNLMLHFRELVVGLEEEQRRLRRHLRELPPPTNPESTTASSSTTTTTTTATNSSSTATNSHHRYASATDDPSSTNTLSSSVTLSTTTASTTRPPPYKSVVKVLPTVAPSTANIPPPQAPLRTKRRSNHRVRITNNIDTENICNSHRILSNLTMQAGRGALIVLEGLDRVGKSTLAKRIVEHLENIKRPVAYHRFPDRTTRVGQLINDFLRDGQRRVNNHIMHLLFSTNRWELDERIRHSIKKGTTIILDRYSYSGIAYSSAKKDLSLELCLETEKGLPRPDLVIYLELPKEAQQKREGFGEERFETEEMQELVRKQYEQVIQLSLEKWIRVDVENKGVEQVLAEVILPVLRCIENSANKELGNLDFEPIVATSKK